MKVKKTYRLEQETIEELEKLCSDSGKSATEVIEGAIHDAIHVPDVERIGDGWAQTVAALTDQLAVKDVNAPATLLEQHPGACYNARQSVPRPPGQHRLTD